LLRHLAALEGRPLNDLVAERQQRLVSTGRYREG
jgi:hypothetical protein